MKTPRYRVKTKFRYAMGFTLSLSISFGNVARSEQNQCAAAVVAAKPIDDHLAMSTTVAELAELRALIDKAKQKGLTVIAKTLAIQYQKELEAAKLTEASATEMAQQQQLLQQALLEREREEARDRELSAEAQKLAFAREKNLRIYHREDLLAETGITVTQFSTDGKFFAVATKDARLMIWDVAERKIIRRMQTENVATHSVFFSPDSKLLITANEDGAARIWNTSSGLLKQTLRGHQLKVTQAVFSPNGKSVATVSADRLLKIWDAETGKLLHSLGRSPYDLESVQFSPDGKRIVSLGGYFAILWNVESGEYIRAFPTSSDFSKQFVFSPDGHYLMTVSATPAYVMVWDLNTNQRAHTIYGTGGEITSITSSPDGRAFLATTNRGRAVLVETATGQAIREFEPQAAPLVTGGFGVDINSVILISTKGALIWNDHATNTDSKPDDSFAYKEDEIIKAALVDPKGSDILISTKNGLSFWRQIAP